jgi:hypothetical protein
MGRRIFYSEKRAQPKSLIMKEILFIAEREYVRKISFPMGRRIFDSEKRTHAANVFFIKGNAIFSYMRGVGKYPF